MHNTLEVEFTRRAEMLACGQQHHRAFDFGKSFFLALSFVKKVPTIHISIWKELPHRSMKNSQFIIDQLFDFHHFLRKTRSHLKNTSEGGIVIPARLMRPVPLYGIPACGRQAVQRDPPRGLAGNPVGAFWTPDFPLQNSGTHKTWKRSGVTTIFETGSNTPPLTILEEKARFRSA
jgi:hypothetical protein